MKGVRYSALHAAIVFAATWAMVAKGFWRTFIHGGPSVPPPQNFLLAALAMQTAVFALLGAVLKLSTMFPRRRGASSAPEAEGTAALKPCAALKKTLFAFPAICVIALSLEFLSVLACEKLFGLTLPQQDLVAWLRPGVYPLPVRLALVATVLVEAPLLEEWLFRGIAFRGLCNPGSGLRMPVWAAMAASGFFFAVMHANAAAFVPLWFLGAAFAHLYARTGTILAPIAAHALFNLANLAICLLAPAA